MTQSTDRDALAVERRAQADRTLRTGGIEITPMVREDYWAWRVRLTDAQSVIAFPKFGTIGVGFAVEEDWNTNLPFSCHAPEIAEHIFHNAGDPSITMGHVIDAVQMIKEAIVADALKGVSA